MQSGVNYMHRQLLGSMGDKLNNSSTRWLGTTLCFVMLKNLWTRAVAVEKKYRGILWRYVKIDDAGRIRCYFSALPMWHLSLVYLSWSSLNISFLEWQDWKKHYVAKSATDLTAMTHHRVIMVAPNFKTFKSITMDGKRSVDPMGLLSRIHNQYWKQILCRHLLEPRNGGRQKKKWRSRRGDRKG